MSAAQRQNFQTSQQDFQVLVDGTVVGTITPSSSNYADYTTPSFSVTAGSHTVTLQALDSAGGDNTAFVDNIRIAGIASGTTTPATPAAATFVKQDLATQGSWKGVYGSQGQFMAAEPSNLPAYAVTVDQGNFLIDPASANAGNFGSAGPFTSPPASDG